jgi:hypothetical protein
MHQIAYSIPKNFRGETPGRPSAGGSTPKPPGKGREGGGDGEGETEGEGGGEREEEKEGGEVGKEGGRYAPWLLGGWTPLLTGQ